MSPTRPGAEIKDGLDTYADIGYQSAIERVQAVTIHLLTSDWLLFHIPDDTSIGTYDDDTPHDDPGFGSGSET